jgi:hypothetical protein
MALRIFLSYASEDKKLAQAIADRLTAAFKFSVELKYMSLFKSGSDFKSVIDYSLDAADILIVVATGKEKLSHTFTGYEIGYYRRSVVSRPYIDEQKKIPRMILPIAILADIPATVSEIQGLEIKPNDRFFFEIDRDGIITGEKNDPIFELFLRIDDVLDKLNPADRSQKQQDAIKEEYRTQAQSFYGDLKVLLGTLPFHTDLPQSRLIVQIPPNVGVTEDEISGKIQFQCSGPTGGIFQANVDEGDPRSEWLTWPSFQNFIGKEDTSLIWGDALLALINSTLKDESADTDQLVLSFDEKKLFRLFVAKSVMFFDRRRELTIYIIEVFRVADVGDPFTTYLAKGLDVALRYRSLFLESASPYGIAAMRFCNANDFKAKVHKMLKEIRYVLFESKDGDLDNNAFIMELYGGDEKAIEKVVGLMGIWNDQSAKLDRAARTIIAKNVISDEDRNSFLPIVEEFVKSTAVINKSYTTRLVSSLEKLLDVQKT